MTKTEIKTILKSAIKNEWVKFKNPSDKDYILSLNDLEEIFDQLSVCEIINGQEFIDDLSDEFENSMD